MRVMTPTLLLLAFISSGLPAQRIEGLREGALVRLVVPGGQGSLDESILVGRVQTAGGDSVRLLLNGSSAVATVSLSSIRWAGVSISSSRLGGAIAGAQDGLFIGLLVGVASYFVNSPPDQDSRSSALARSAVVVGSSTAIGAVYGATRRFSRWVRVSTGNQRVEPEVR